MLELGLNSLRRRALFGGARLHHGERGDLIQDILFKKWTESLRLAKGEILGPVAATQVSSHDRTGNLVRLPEREPLIPHGEVG